MSRLRRLSQDKGDLFPGQGLAAKATTPRKLKSLVRGDMRLARWQGKIKAAVSSWTGRTIR
jgi:hypothetical protein